VTSDADLSQKTRMLELSLDNKFSRFDTIPDSEGQTDRQTDGHFLTTVTPLMHSITQTRLWDSD